MTSINNTRTLIENVNPSVLINLIGLTDIQKCEDNLDYAYKINTKTVENISSICKLKKIQLIHVSTDHFYDDIQPSKEEDVKITNNYSITKYAAELSALQCGSVVLRTNFIGKSTNPKTKFNRLVI